MPNDPRCRQIRRLLPLVAGDAEGSDLSWEDRRLVERHLIGCGPCRDRRDSLESAVGVLRLAASVAPIPPEVRSVWPDLSRQIRGTRHPRPSHWFGLGFGGSVGLAASLLLLGTAIGLLGSRLAALPARPSPTLAPPASFADSSPSPRRSVPESLDLAGGSAPLPLAKPDAAHAALDVDSKGAAGHLRDPQRSQ